MNARNRTEARASRPQPPTQHGAAGARVRRNFWVLVTATVVAVGLLSRVIDSPASPLTAVVVAVSGLAGLVSLTLAGRILVVTTAGRPRSRRRASASVRRPR